MNAIVTGASKGIGRSISHALAKSNYNLVCSARTQQDLTILHDNLKSSCPHSKIIVSSRDLAIREQAIELGKFSLEVLDSIDVLVNNLGVYTPTLMTEESDDAFTKHMNTNFYSAFYLTRTLLPHFIERNKGSIVNICSVECHNPKPNMGSYSVSKSVLYTWSKVLRQELKETGIRVINISPGITMTDSWRGTDLSADRFLDPDDVAQAVIMSLGLNSNSVIEDIIMRPQKGDL